MNILQTITSNGGALQVIQAQTVQKSSSRRAITSSTYSSQFCTTGNSPFPSGHRLSGDLLVRLINALLWLVDWSPFVSSLTHFFYQFSFNSPSAHVHHCITTKLLRAWRPYSHRRHRISWLVLCQPTTPQLAEIIYFIMRITTCPRTWA